MVRVIFFRSWIVVLGLSTVTFLTACGGSDLATSTGSTAPTAVSMSPTTNSARSLSATSSSASGVAVSTNVADNNISCPTLPTVAASGLMPVGTFSPKNPAASGYGLVFDSEFNDFNDFDMSCNSSDGSRVGCQNPQGKNWYLSSPIWPTKTTPRKDLTISNGILTINQTFETVNWSIASVGQSFSASHGPNDWQKGWNGKVFGGGWYVEARLAGKLSQTADHVAFWSRAIEGYGRSNQWLGQSEGYAHFAENDMVDGLNSSNYYTSQLVDWYGAWGVQCPQICSKGVGGSVHIPNIDLSDNTFHVFGQLWVPATAATQGYIQNFVDGIPTSRFTWNQFDPKAPPPPTDEAVGSVLDSNHMHLVLGTGVSVPAYFDWVHVWQLPASAAESGNAFIKPQVNFSGGNGSCIL